MTLPRVTSSITTVVIAAALALPVPAAASDPSPSTTRLSVSADGVQADDRSETPAISGDGRVVAFTSIASNLVPGDTNRGGQFAGPNGGKDVFVRDLSSQAIERVSVRSDGAQSGFNSVSDAPALTRDGRFVAFHSSAALDPLDFNGRQDIYVHDRAERRTELVSRASDGGLANEDSSYPAISANGRYVAFYSWASNLVPGDANSTIDIFVRDLQSGATQRVSVASDGTQANGFSLFPSLSADGRFVSFVSQASNLVAHEVLGLFDVYVHDRETGETEHISVTSNGTIGNEISYFSALSGDGRYVAFDSTANNLVPEDRNGVSDVFIRDRQRGLTTRISVSSFAEELNGHSFHPSITPDGRFVSFTSEARNVVDDAPSGVRKLYLHDRLTGATTLVSRALGGGEPNGPTETDTALHTLSDDARNLAISSGASNLVPADTNDQRDVFVIEQPAHDGIANLSVERVEGGLSVSGTTRAAGAVVGEAADDAQDAAPGATFVGGELIGVRLAYRPTSNDLLATMTFASPPKSPAHVRMFSGTQNIRPPLPGGTVGIVHTLTFTTGGQRYEIRSLAAGLSGNPPSVPFFALYRCEPVCLQVGKLRGGHTTTGPQVVVAVPLDLLAAEEGSALTGIRASAALGDATPGGVVTLDTAVVADVTIPQSRVSLGIAPRGTPEEEVDFDFEAAVDDVDFSGIIDVSGLASGDYEVWAKSCLADVCGSASRTLILGALEKIDTTLDLTVVGRGNHRTLTAHLAELDALISIADRTIDFYGDGELIGTTTTDGDGVATLQVPPRYRGARHMFEARFEGDDDYLASVGGEQT